MHLHQKKLLDNLLAQSGGQGQALYALLKGQRYAEYMNISRTKKKKKGTWHAFYHT